MASVGSRIGETLLGKRFILGDFWGRELKSLYDRPDRDYERMNRTRLATGLLIIVVASVMTLVPVWLGHQRTNSSTKTIDIQHALFKKNDTSIGNPQPGHIFADFSLRIMNCGYESFRVAPSLFSLRINGVTYQASNVIARLPSPLPTTMLVNGQEIFGEIAYEIPANAVVPLTPIVYTLSNSYTINWVSDW